MMDIATRAQSSDEALVAYAREGDTRSFGVLCERHRARIWRVAASVADGADADDIAQEATIRAYQALGRYRSDAPFAAWLTRIAANAAHDYRRSAWRRRAHPLSAIADWHDQGADAEELALSRDTQRTVRQAVADLPGKERTPVWLHYFEGFSVAEIARLEHTPEATMRSRMRSGLMRLGRTLGELAPVTGGRDTGALREAKRCGT
jgi:RNA polymerase sigma-70 factor (ECF subfamily)